MPDTQLTWKVFRASPQDLESTLNKVSALDYEVFAVHPSDTGWTIIARTGASSPDRKPIGFGPGR